MKLNTTSTIALAALLTLAAASAQVPAILNYQGRVSIGGSNYNGTGLFKFALVNSNGTEVFWNNAGAVTTNEPANAVSLVVAQGLYSVLVGDTSLGNMAAIPQTVFTNNDLRLRVWFSPGPDGIFMPFSPDQRLGAAAYAMRAAAADNANPTNISGNLTVSGVLSAGQLIGGSNNTASGNNSSVPGGTRNTNAGYAAFLGGGESNSIASTASNAVIGGGAANVATTNYATVVGGQNNTVGGAYSTIGGGRTNTAGGEYATVGGGISNMASGFSAVISGGWENAASGHGASISGGVANKASGEYATIGGGLINSNGGTRATTIGGGEFNRASGEHATIGGGEQNIVVAPHATISGGRVNTADGDFAAIGGGRFNTASGEYATIAGGRENTASGTYATVPGGTRGKATNVGSFVWSGDAVENTVSFGDHTFTVRAEGGARFYTANGTNTGTWLASGSGAWTSLSDRNAKENFEQVDGTAILAKVAAIPVMSWNYKTQAEGIRHIGPTAQDFKQAFGIGETDTGITTVDADGVALAAIQGLVQELKARDARIERLEAELGEIRKQLGNLPPAP